PTRRSTELLTGIGKVEPEMLNGYVVKPFQSVLVRAPLLQPLYSSRWRQLLLPTMVIKSFRTSCEKAVVQNLSRYIMARMAKLNLMEAMKTGLKCVMLWLTSSRLGPAVGFVGAYSIQLQVKPERHRLKVLLKESAITKPY